MLNRNCTCITYKVIRTLSFNALVRPAYMIVMITYFTKVDIRFIVVGIFKRERTIDSFHLIYSAFFKKNSFRVNKLLRGLRHFNVIIIYS